MSAQGTRSFGFSPISAIWVIFVSTLCEENASRGGSSGSSKKWVFAEAPQGRASTEQRFARSPLRGVCGIELAKSEWWSGSHPGAATSATETAEKANEIRDFPHAFRTVARIEQSGRWTRFVR